MKIVKKIIDTLITLLLICLVGFTLISGDKVPYILGYRALNVLTGSMEPTIKQGSLVFIKDVPYEDLQIDDVICFRPNNGNSKVTHRIVEKDENDEFITKGDANNASDVGTVSKDEFEGKVVLKISYIGSILYFLKSNLIITIIIACIILFIPEIIGKLLKKDER